MYTISILSKSLERNLFINNSPISEIFSNESSSKISLFVSITLKFFDKISDPFLPIQKKETFSLEDAAISEQRLITFELNAPHKPLFEVMQTTNLLLTFRGFK